MKTLRVACTLILAVALIVSSGLLIGCATSSASINTYVDPTFDGSGLERIAIFPVRNTRLAPSEAQQLNRNLSQAISKRRPSMAIMGSAEAIQVLNDSGLADEWARFLDNYTASGIPNAAVLRDIGQVLGVDAIIQGEIVNIQQFDGVYGGNPGTTRVTVRYSMMGVRSGKLLWEASSDGVRTTGTTLEGAPPIIEAVKLAQQKILSTLPF